ncbi:c-type cytochrome [Rubrimonas cliftonensis]|nr:hypothetical protein [Rubrimonas cliftonensis]
MARLAATASLLCAAAAAAEPLDGRAIFTGAVVGLEDGATARRLARSPCHSCHGRDGRGGVEGDAPPIDWSVLSRQTIDRLAYDEARFARAVVEGVDSSGRALSRLMPRYAFSQGEIAALQDYLERIGAEQRTGATANSVTFGLPELPGSPVLTEELAVAIRSGLADALGGGTVWGRSVEIVTFRDGAPPPSMLAVLSPRVEAVPGYAALGVPTLFPLGALEGDEDPSIVRAATPSRAGVRAALAGAIAAADPASVTIIATPDTRERADAEALGLALRLESPAMSERIRISPGARKDAATDRDALVILSEDGLNAARGWPGPVWLSWSALQAAGGALEGGHPLFAVVETPWIVRRAIETGGHPIIAHGERIGAATAEALMAAGRNLTRGGLLEALEDARLDEWGLDYATHPLTGAADVMFVTLNLRQN